MRIRGIRLHEGDIYHNDNVDVDDITITNGSSNNPTRDLAVAFLRLTNTEKQLTAVDLGVYKDGDDCRLTKTHIAWARCIRESNKVEELREAVAQRRTS